MNFYEHALAYQHITLENRRFLHEHAEVGLDLPVTRQFVLDRLREYGIPAEPCGQGVTGLIGKGAPVILLRADMDALPMEEQSGLPFACPTGKAAHTCGHDLHTAMLLTAAKLLKEQESALKGTIKLMFQPAEETFEGSSDMLAHGILENPKVDAALAFHVTAGKHAPGIFMYNSTGTMMSSADGFRIEISGKGGHGAYPHLTVDPLRIAVQIYHGLESLMAREVDSRKNCVLTIGQIHGGNAANIIPDTAVMEGTLRTNDSRARRHLIGRVSQISEEIARLCGGSAKVISLSEVPPLICDHDVTERMVRYLAESDLPKKIMRPEISAGASEDFAFIAEKVPSAYLYLSAGFDDGSETYAAHNPTVRFHEDVLPIGAAAFAQCAARWLEDNLQ